MNCDSMIEQKIVSLQKRLDTQCQALKAMELSRARIFIHLKQDLIISTLLFENVGYDKYKSTVKILMGGNPMQTGSNDWKYKHW